MQSDVALLGPAEVRALAEQFAVRPTKKLGQNFVHDPNTVRRIVRLAGVSADDVVLEVGPGLGSLTLGLLATGARVVAVEVDPVLADRLPATVASKTSEPGKAGKPGEASEAGAVSAATSRLTVLTADALRLRAEDLATAAVSDTPDAVSCTPDVVSDTPDVVSDVPDAVSCTPDTPSVAQPNLLVANLPYNVAVPVVLHLLGELPSLRRALVMVQTEVADRMAAGPGSRVYGVPSVKLAWYGTAHKVAPVPRAVFWPVPNVDSALVSFERHPDGPAAASTVDRDQVFAVADAAFAQRRKTLRAALASWAGSAQRAERILRAADVEPTTRGEQLTVADFARIAHAAL
ncbi:ribosomal RNA small subunit methyltransferase A [Haloechinothrix salitolerans]|uniref:Ribosomal RNA small subunit methyltransferase A n=1 Tax=Haloechinothrix salitolerans TaxID=926830 RepID=A0ABW2BWB0_9PSEU